MRDYFKFVVQFVTWCLLRMSVDLETCGISGQTNGWLNVTLVPGWFSG